MDLSKDYYQILQVHPKADPLIIKRAYRTLMVDMKKHPDKGGTLTEAQRINEAYEVLSNEKLRAEYDRERSQKGHRTGRRPTPRSPRPAPPKEYYIITCQSCGQKNRIPAGSNFGEATCGRCRYPLSYVAKESSVDREYEEMRRRIENDMAKEDREIAKWTRRLDLANQKNRMDLAREAMDRLNIHIKAKESLKETLNMLKKG